MERPVIVVCLILLSVLGSSSAQLSPQNRLSESPVIFPNAANDSGLQLGASRVTAGYYKASILILGKPGQGCCTALNLAVLPLLRTGQTAYLVKGLHVLAARSHP